MAAQHQARTDSASPGGGRPPLLLAGTVATALFMELVDTSALSTALPTLAEAFGVSPLDLRLALTAYLLTVAVLVPASGWLADRFGAKRVFMAALVLFVLGSIAASAAQSVAQLVAARVLQGVGGSMMTPVGRAIVVGSTPRHELVRALNWFIIPGMLGPMIGPSLAAVALAVGSWRWIFLINVPIGLAGLIAVWRIAPDLPASPERRRFDGVGFVLAGAAIALLMSLAETVGAAHASPALRVTLAVGGAAALAAYLVHARGRADPVLDLRLLRRPVLGLNLAAGSLHRMLISATAFLLPLLIQTALGMSPAATGAALVSMSIGGLGARFVTPPILRRIGFRAAMLLFGALSAVSLAAPLALGGRSPLWLVSAMMLLLGALRTGFFVPNGVLVFADVEPDEANRASTLNAVSQQLSFALGLSFAGAALVWSSAGGTLRPEHFRLAFAALAVLGLLGTALVLFLPRDVGSGIGGAGPAAT